MSSNSNIDVKLSICILTKNSETLIENSIKNAKSITPSVHVLDFGSTDQTLTLIKNANVFLHRFDNSSISEAKNCLIENINTPFILFLNDNETLEIDASTDLVKECIHNHIDAVSFPIWTSTSDTSISQSLDNIPWQFALNFIINRRESYEIRLIRKSSAIRFDSDYFGLPICSTANITTSKRHIIQNTANYLDRIFSFKHTILNTIDSDLQKILILDNSQKLKIATTLLALGKIETSKRLYTLVLEKDPENSEAHIGLFICHASSKKWAYAITELQFVHHHDKACPIPYIYLPFLYLQSGHYNECLHILEKGVNICGHLAVYNFYAGIVFKSLGEYKNSNDALLKIPDNKDTNPIVYIHLANNYANIEEYDESIRYLKKALTHELTRKYAMIKLIEVSWMTSNNVSFRRWLELSLIEYPHDSTILYYGVLNSLKEKDLFELSNRLSSFPVNYSLSKSKILKLIQICDELGLHQKSLDLKASLLVPYKEDIVESHEDIPGNVMEAHHD